MANTVNFKSQAGKYANQFGMANLVEEGMGREYTDTLMQTGFRRLGQGLVAGREQMGNSFINSGMQFTGVAESKGPNELLAQTAAQAMQIVNDVTAQDEKFKLDMAGRYINVLSHEDNYDLKLRELALQEEAMQDDLLSVMGKVGSIASAFTPFI